MNYNAEICVVSDSLKLEFDRRVSFDPSVARFTSFTFAGRCIEPDMLKEIFSVNGITHVQLYDYGVKFFKAKMFSWNEITPQIIKTLEDGIGEELVESTLPISSALLCGLSSGRTM